MPSANNEVCSRCVQVQEGGVRNATRESLASWRSSLSASTADVFATRMRGFPSTLWCSAFRKPFRGNRSPGNSCREGTAHLSEASLERPLRRRVGYRQAGQRSSRDSRARECVHLWSARMWQVQAGVDHRASRPPVRKSTLAQREIRARPDAEAASPHRELARRTPCAYHQRRRQPDAARGR